MDLGNRFHRGERPKLTAPEPEAAPFRWVATAVSAALALLNDNRYCRGWRLRSHL